MRSEFQSRQATPFCANARNGYETWKTWRCEVTERKGKYVLAGPVPAAYDWWSINDMVKGYSIVTVQASFPNAEQVIRNAWAQLPEE
jgi:hypothetical protein